jgi:HD-GYP domain-containing protein (c-di-GMP phosphodiesterase class II)
MPCDHSATHSGGARYLRGSSQLQLVLLCDDCGAELVQLGRVDYRLEPRRVAVQVAELIARELELGASQADRVRFAALVCGVGRDKLPAAIMYKAGPLTAQEWAEVQRQPELAAALLNDVSMDDIREWILCYRERPDGSGYPRGLRGDEIPIEARILAVADAYTAIVSDRPYRARRDHEQACQELIRCAGTQFDGEVVKAFLRASGENGRTPGLSRAGQALSAD